MTDTTQIEAAAVAERLAEFRASPAEADAALARMTAGHRAATAPPAPTKPTTAIEAAARLKELTSDPAWVREYTSGGIEQRRELAALTEQVANGDPLDSVMAGIEPSGLNVDLSGTRASPRDQIAAVAAWRDQGIGDRAIREILSDLKPTREEHNLAKYNNARRFADPVWVAALMAGDPLAQQDFWVNCWGIGCYEET
jgi:hypothetical protein